MDHAYSGLYTVINVVNAHCFITYNGIVLDSNTSNNAVQAR